jgi:cytochrome c oxidase assembly factor CtaG
VLNLDQLPLALVILALVLHLLGERRATRVLARPRGRTARWRAVSFYAGLAFTVAALEGPVDKYATSSLWVHMLQHVLLIGFAAPLIVLGAPWMSIWRPLPLGLRRALARTVARSPALSPLRAAGRQLSRPAPAWVAFNVALLVWHVPGLYDPAVRSEAVHMLEHVTFMLLAIMLWAQLIDSPPLRARLGTLQRVYYCASSLIPGWVLSLVLAFAAHPLYPYYAHVGNRPGRLSALVDQQLAGGIMLGLGSLAGTIYVFLGLYRWLGEDTPRRSAGRQEYA